MLNTEVASIMKEDGKIYKTAEKSMYNLALSSEEKEIASTLDAWAKDIGNRGVDVNNEIASLVTKTVQTELYNAPDELLDELRLRLNHARQSAITTEISEIAGGAAALQR